MHVAQQFSIFMVNKPGVLSQILDEFANEKINITAITMMDSVEHGVMRVVFTGAEKAKQLLSKLNLPYNATDVLCVTLNNQAGAFAYVVEKLAKSHINISYAYCTAGAKGGKTTGIFKVPDNEKAMKVLENTVKKSSKSKPTVRRSKAVRK